MISDFQKSHRSLKTLISVFAALEKSTIESAIPDELVAQYQDEVKRLKETLGGTA
jgi:hypothetical protein